jgi:hypothetical protein
LIAPFSTGTHDWERREVLVIPRKPIDKVFVHLLLRNHAGTVWFDDIQMEILEGLQVLDMQTTRQPTLRVGKGTVRWGRAGDLQVQFDDAGLVTQLLWRGKPLPKGKLPGGWFLRDMQNPDVLVPFSGRWTSRSPLVWTGRANGRAAGGALRTGRRPSAGNRHTEHSGGQSRPRGEPHLGSAATDAGRVLA